MSASDIATNETLVSNDDTDLTKLSAEELLAVVAELRQENKILLRSKNKVGLTFKRIPEDGNDSITRLEDNQFPFLTKIDSLSVTKDESTDGNIALIEGENLAVLAALQMTHKEKVDVIYIDPPYNTGNDDFIYEDKRMYKSDSSDLENLEETLDGKARTVGKDDPFRHSKWLSFMERRLFLAKELLSDTGVIFVSIDDNEQARLKLLLDDVFGRENFLGTITWFKKRKGSFLSKGIISVTEYINVYKKKNPVELSGGMADNSESQPIIKRTNSIGSLYFESGIIKTKLSDGIYKQGRYGVGTSSSYLENDITIENGIILSSFSLSAPFVWSQEFLDKEIKNGTEVSINTINFQPRALRHNNISHKGFPSLIDGRTFSATNEDGYESLKKIFEEDSIFSYPKPTNLIKKLISSATFSKKDAIILDFFAGSGTTGHAVADLNKEDGGNRSAILVTNNEGGIARNVTRERLARVLTGENWADGKEHEALPGNLFFYTLGFKTLSSNPLSTAQMMENKFDGLLSLENNALNVVENNLDEDYAIYRNSGKVVFVWKNLFSLYDGECEDLLESLKATMDADEFIAYVPSDSKDPGISSDGWKVIAFPHDYIERYEAMIATMRRNQTLPNSK